MDIVDSNSYKVIERFVFEVESLLPQDSAMTLNEADLEGFLRGFLLKISLCNGILKPAPKGRTYLRRMLYE